MLASHLATNYINGIYRIQKDFCTLQLFVQDIVYILIIYLISKILHFFMNIFLFFADWFVVVSYFPFAEATV